MFSDIQHWCRSCCDCATRKTPRNRHKAPLLPIPIQDAFDRISCDIVGFLPTTERGFSYVLVITEFLTKWYEAFPIKSIDAATIARIIVDEIFTRHGALRTLLTDRGSNFLSSLMKEVCHLLNIKKLNTTAYHPQTDGLVERFNGTLIESISMFCNSHQTDWDIFIPSILFAYRVSPCVATGDSPFYLLHGREPRLAPDVSLLPPTDLSTSVAEHRRRIVTQVETAQSLARDNIARAQQLMKLQYDRTAADAPFEVGERCCVYTPKVKRGLKKKLCHLWHGPFRICRKLSSVHYQLRTCDNRLVATTVHANRMKHFYDPADRPILPPMKMILMLFPFNHQTFQKTVLNQMTLIHLQVLMLSLPLTMVSHLIPVLLILQICSQIQMFTLLKRFSSSDDRRRKTRIPCQMGKFPSLPKHMGTRRQHLGQEATGRLSQ